MDDDTVCRLEGLLGFLVANKFERPDQAATAGIADERMVAESVKSSLKYRRDLLHMPDDVALLVNFQGFQCDGGGDRMSAIGKTVPEDADLFAFRTMLVVTHEMAFARDVSSKVVFLHKGVVEEEGDPDEVFRRPRSERFKQFLSNER